MFIDVVRLCDCIYASRRGLAALLILNGGNARPERRISRSTDSNVFLCNLDPESLSGTDIDLNLMSDQEIVQGILDRDVELTKQYLYREYYPLFKSVWNKYYTDCNSCVEFINTIYVYIMTPGPHSGKSPLESFGFRCRFVLWLKIVAENYCKQLFHKRLEIADGSEPTDRNVGEPSTLDISAINHRDIEIVLAQMPNMRYRTLIRYRYLEEKSNEETAQLLGMSMDNYYNKHKLAKEQFVTTLKKEGIC